MPNLAKAIPSYQSMFGYELISGPFDDPIQKVAVCFLSRGAGDMTVELVAPLDKSAPVAKVLAQRAGAYHVCYEVPSMDEAIAHLSANGCSMVSEPVPAVAFDQRQIAWLFTPTWQLIELVCSGSKS